MTISQTFLLAFNDLDSFEEYWSDRYMRNIGQNVPQFEFVSWLEWSFGEDYHLGKGPSLS